jgi:hypothetical protein
MRLILVRVLWNFDLELGPDMDENWRDSQKIFVLWIKGAMNVRVRRVVRDGGVKG